MSYDSGIPPGCSAVWRERSGWLLALLDDGPRPMRAILDAAKRDEVRYARHLVAWCEGAGLAVYDGRRWHRRQKGSRGREKGPRTADQLADHCWPTHQAAAVLGAPGGLG